MRVIRTEVYLETTLRAVSKRKVRSPGLSAAFVGYANNGIRPGNSPAALASLIFDRHLEFRQFADEQHAANLVFAVASEYNYDEIYKNNWSYEDSLISLRKFGQEAQNEAKNLMGFEFVIEQSPPSLMKLSDAFKKTPSILIGSYIGQGIADGSYPLMLLTIPIGIVVVGSAIGVSRGLENGLSRSVQKLLSSR